MPEPTVPLPFDHPPRPWSQRLGAVLWPSFFAAGVATAVCFAWLDPQDLAALVVPGAEPGRGVVYTAGFFLFWVATAASSLFTWLLLRPASRYNRPLPAHKQ